MVILKQFTILFLSLILWDVNLHAQTLDVAAFGAKPNSFADATVSVQKAIEAAKGNQQTTIIFPDGRYDFWPDSAAETHYYISNTSSEKEFPVKKQKGGLLLKNLKNVTIQGNGSLFVFHGKMIAWVIDSCENINIKNIKVDYERPGMSEMTIQDVTSSSVTATIHPDSKYAILNGKLEWYGEKWVTRNHHAVLAKPQKEALYHSTWQPFLNSEAIEIAPLTVIFTGDFSKFKADKGDVLTIRDRYRDYVGAFHNRSKNIFLDSVQIFFMHGLGVVSQFCENLHYKNVYIEPEKNSGRVIASSADGLHFSGCRGHISIDHCRFSGLQDDPVNVHGTYLKVTGIISPTTLKLQFKHHQTYGFLPFIAGDSVAYVHPSSLQIFSTGVIKKSQLINEREVMVELQQAVSKQLKIGDALENISWTPSLHVSNSRFAGTVSRGLIFKTRRNVLVENNEFYHTGMHAILIRTDATDWYESGPVMNAIIRNNRFIECGHNIYPASYPIKISPNIKSPAKDYHVYHNIKIENNYFKTYGSAVLWADYTKGLSFKNNRIQFADANNAANQQPAIRLTSCTKVSVSKNQFENRKPQLQALQMQRKDLKSDIEY